MRLPAGILLALALASPPAVAAQYATPYGPVQGSRVRVTAPRLLDEPLHGELLAFAGDSLVLRVSDGRATLRLPVTELTRVEVSDGHDRAGTAFRYAVGGTLVGGTLGVVGMRREDGLAQLLGMILGSAMGMFIGGGIGGATAPESWRVVWTGEAAR